MCGPRSSDRGARFRTPLTMVMLVFGGMTYTRPGSTRTPCVTSTTGSGVVLDRISLRMLGYFGSRCWTSTKAIAASRDRCASNSENASNPPAEAPMPTIGKVSLDRWGTATVPRAGKVARCSRVAVLIGEGRAGGRARLLPVGERGDRDDLFIAMLRSRLLAQNASLHRQANVTTVRRKCQAFVRPSEMRVCPSRRACPGGMEELSRLCSRKRDRPSLSADPNRASASRRRFQRLLITVEMWTRRRTLSSPDDVAG